MLPDLERKLLRILVNFKRKNRRMPRKPELERMTGQKYDAIERALNNLAQDNYIFWPDRPALDTIVTLEYEDRDIPKTRRTTGTAGDIRYWTEY